MPRLKGLLAAFAACLMLGGCATYPPPGAGPTEPPPPPPSVRVYKAMRPLPLPPGLATGLLASFRAPPIGYAPGIGLLFSVWPSRGGLPAGLYAQEAGGGGPPRLLVRIAPGRAGLVATSAAVGGGYLAYQLGPRSGPTSRPLLLTALRMGGTREVVLPRADRGDLAALPGISGHYLDFLAVHDGQATDRTAAVACRLPGGPCRDLVSRDSGRDGMDVIAVAGDGARVDVVLNPVGGMGNADAEVLSISQSGGTPKVLWRGPGVITSVVALQGSVMFTLFSGTDGALYLLDGGGLVRLTAPGQFPSHPSYGGGYVTWWDGAPCVFELGSGRAYKVPGSLPELFGSLLTFVTPQGVRWVRLPPN